MEDKKIDPKPFHYKHARAEVATDVVVFGYRPTKPLHVLLQYKDISPQKDGTLYRWSLPGRFIHGSEDPNNEYDDTAETLDDCLREGLCISTLVFGKEVPVWDAGDKYFDEYLPPRTEIIRDDRGKRVISLPVMRFVGMQELSQLEESFVRWVSFDEIKRINEQKEKLENTDPDKDLYILPFDHYQILLSAMDRLQEIVRVKPLGREILGDRFTINQLRLFYESVLGRAIDRATFRNFVEQKTDCNGLPLFRRTAFKDQTASNRPAFFYEFDAEAYKNIENAKDLGFNPNYQKGNIKEAK